MGCALPSSPLAWGIVLSDSIFGMSVCRTSGNFRGAGAGAGFVIIAPRGAGFPDPFGANSFASISLGFIRLLFQPGL